MLAEQLSLKISGRTIQKAGRIKLNLLFRYNAGRTIHKAGRINPGSLFRQNDLSIVQAEHSL